MIFDLTPSHARANAKQSGFVLPATLVILVLASVLAVSAAKLTQIQQSSRSADAAATLAESAARAGIEYGLYKVRAGHGAAAAPACFAPQDLTLPGVMSDYQARVTCAVTTDLDGQTTVNVYRIDSVACNAQAGQTCPLTDEQAAASQSYVERRMVADTVVVVCTDPDYIWDGGQCTKRAEDEK